LEELTSIYKARGVPPALARQVAVALDKAGPLEAHLRDELGHHESTAARPLQASLASASSFLLGGLVPFLGLFASTTAARLVVIVLVTMPGLLLAGVLGAGLPGRASRSRHCAS
jgi:VIT1/CCC1 family predicted Fe2+/Mn2+ transporter